MTKKKSPASNVRYIYEGQDFYFDNAFNSVDDLVKDMMIWMGESGEDEIPVYKITTEKIGQVKSQERFHFVPEEKP